MSIALSASCAGQAAMEPSAPVRQDDGDGQPAARARARQRTPLRLPFEGTWAVSQGYDGETSHRGYAAYALDFVKLDARGRAHVRSGKRRKHWHGFGAELLATADGVVVRAVDDIADNPIFGKATTPNRLIIRHTADELSEYVHLRRGSLRVGVGDRVRRGQVLAEAGNSGAQTPHLHWALLSSIEPILTRPATFDRYEVRDADGTWRRTTGVPRKGDVVRPGASDPRPALAWGGSRPPAPYPLRSRPVHSKLNDTKTIWVPDIQK